MRISTHLFGKYDIIVLLVFPILISLACRPPDKNGLALTTDRAVNDSISYARISSRDFSSVLLFDENNILVDTVIPPMIKSIRDGQYHGIAANEGIVKDALTAKRLALVILESFYGKEQIHSEEPFEVSLIDDKYWFVCGTLPDGHVGGVAEILISRENGRVLYLGHGK